ncbi:MAG: metallophosphoesterase family protein [Polyangiaceae bacterium]
MRFLCISDIHGHADALAAVLATGDRYGYRRLLVAGDHCFPGPAPLETWRRLMQTNATLVQGVGDRALATLDVSERRASSQLESDRLQRLRDVRTELGQLILMRLEKLPPTERIPLEDGRELLLVHGSPMDPTENLSHEMSDEELMALIGDDPADIVVCGGTHVPFDRTVSGVRILNVGSVGEAPGGKFAHATILDVTSTETTVEQIAIPLLDRVSPALHG